jgi:hypothetical protein
MQNNKLTHLPEEVMEYVTDTLRVVDVTGNNFLLLFPIAFFKKRVIYLNICNLGGKKEVNI